VGLCGVAFCLQCIALDLCGLALSLRSIALQLSSIALGLGRIQRPLQRCKFFDAGRLCHWYF
jgi:hypothetical protein